MAFQISVWKMTGGYLFPNLVLGEEAVTIGKYGMLRRTFLKEYKNNWYQSMMLSGKLDQLAWAAHMNGLLAMAEESVLQEIIYNAENPVP